MLAVFPMALVVFTNDETAVCLVVVTLLVIVVAVTVDLEASLSDDVSAVMAGPVAAFRYPILLAELSVNQIPPAESTAIPHGPLPAVGTSYSSNILALGLNLPIWFPVTEFSVNHRQF